jgi:hypothetical protein
MVQYNEESVVVTIENPHPHEFIHALQTGVINMVQSLLTVRGINEDLILDDETKEGCWNALEVVKATLPDPQVMETIGELAQRVMPPPVGED